MGIYYVSFLRIDVSILSLPSALVQVVIIITVVVNTVIYIIIIIFMLLLLQITHTNSTSTRRCTQWS
jgi:hypothetical protein